MRIKFKEEKKKTSRVVVNRESFNKLGALFQHNDITLSHSNPATEGDEIDQS